ncbi:MAG: SpoIIE family protein phosphatase [Actinobacteria bacterium]|nr:SpoIIE family protein phosphatase [Actinomycetota bacterium]
MRTPEWLNRLKRNYQILTSDLNFAAIETLIKSDAPSMLEFYTRDAKQPARKRNRFVRTLSLLKNLFIAFVIKLTPARRIIYLVALYFFISGIFSSRLLHSLIGFLLVNILLAFELANKLTAKDELEVARSIQLDLMPKTAPHLPHFDITFFSETAREVGGDFYDFVPMNGSTHAMMVIIGDISGKGMGAALHMVQVHTIMKDLGNEGDIKERLVEFNKRLKNLFPPETFLTSTFVGIERDNSIKLCRAGHLPLIYYASRNKSCSEITPGGIGIGLADSTIFASSLQEQSLDIFPGDVLVLYSDGLSETMNKTKEEFGEERIKTIIKKTSLKTALEIKEAILKSIVEFRGLTPPHDDLTLIVMKAH